MLISEKISNCPPIWKCLISEKKFITRWTQQLVMFQLFIMHKFLRNRSTLVTYRNNLFIVSFPLLKVQTSYFENILLQKRFWSKNKISQSMTIKSFYELWSNEKKVRNLNIVNYQTPMAHVKIAPGHSFGQFLQQYLLHAYWILRLFWLILQRPEKKEYTYYQFSDYIRLNW